VGVRHRLANFAPELEVSLQNSERNSILNFPIFLPNFSDFHTEFFCFQPHLIPALKRSSSSTPKTPARTKTRGVTSTAPAVLTPFSLDILPTSSTRAVSSSTKTPLSMSGTPSPKNLRSMDPWPWRSKVSGFQHIHFSFFYRFFGYFSHSERQYSQSFA
jgi:hypothetical protein